MGATRYRRAGLAAAALGTTTITVLILASPALAAGTGSAPDYGPVPVPASGPSVSSQPWFLPVALALVGVGLLVLLTVAFLSANREASTSGRVGRRLGKYSLAARGKDRAPADTPSGALGNSQVARSAVDLAGRVVQKRDLDTTLGTRLEAAGVPLRPAEWLVLHTGLPIVLGLGLLLLTDFNLMAALLGVGVGIALPFGYLMAKESKRKAAFAAQLPDTLQLLAGSLATGYSLAQATDVVVRESAAPMSVELGRALVEARLGVPLEDALEATATRMDSVDFAWVVMAIRIQREVGGNLAEVLNTVAATMRERERLRRQVQVLSAEGRLSAAILGGLPLLLIVYLVLVRPSYISELVTSSLGIMLSVIGVALLVGGMFWLRKVVKVEV